MTPIKIQLPNGLFLTAEASDMDGFPEVVVGITDINDRWLQDLAVVKQAFTFNGTTVKPDDAIKVYVYGDKDDEDWTNEFEVGFWKGAE